MQFMQSIVYAGIPCAAEISEVLDAETRLDRAVYFLERESYPEMVSDMQAEARPEALLRILENDAASASLITLLGRLHRTPVTLRIQRDALGMPVYRDGKPVFVPEIRVFSLRELDTAFDSLQDFAHDYAYSRVRSITLLLANIGVAEVVIAELGVALQDHDIERDYAVELKKVSDAELQQYFYEAAMLLLDPRRASDDEQTTRRRALDLRTILRETYTRIHPRALAALRQMIAAEEGYVADRQIGDARP